MDTLRRCKTLLALAVAAALLLPDCTLAASQPTTEMTLRQRSSSPLPGWDSSTLQLVVDDITGGAVLAWVTQDGQALAGPQRLQPGASLRFEFQQQAYEAQLLRLDNVLIGEDFARFLITPVAAPARVLPAAATADADTSTAPTAVATRIEQLLQRIAREPGAVLIRNDSDYPVDQAVAHLRRKWRQQDAAITSVELFIQRCATRSEQSGQPYRIRLADSTELELATWLRQLR